MTESVVQVKKPELKNVCLGNPSLFLGFSIKIAPKVKLSSNVRLFIHLPINGLCETSALPSTVETF